jgi:3-hydroxyisobutyrate dehydrogenase
VSNPKIGFFGLGTMGGQLARRLLSTGYEVTGFDVSDARTKQARDAGVTLASSPAAAAKGTDVVLSSLPDPAIVRGAYLGADGVLSATRSGATLIDMSTIDPARGARSRPRPAPPGWMPSTRR